MDPRLQAHAAHPQRLFDAVLIVDDEFLGKDMDDFAIHRDGNRLGGIDDPPDIIRR